MSETADCADLNDAVVVVSTLLMQAMRPAHSLTANERAHALATRLHVVSRLPPAPGTEEFGDEDGLAGAGIMDEPPEPPVEHPAAPAAPITHRFGPATGVDTVPETLGTQGNQSWLEGYAGVRRTMFSDLYLYPARLWSEAPWTQLGLDLRSRRFQNSPRRSELGYSLGLRYRIPVGGHEYHLVGAWLREPAQADPPAGVDFPREPFYESMQAGAEARLATDRRLWVGARSSACAKPEHRRRAHVRREFLAEPSPRRTMCHASRKRWIRSAGRTARSPACSTRRRGPGGACAGGP